MSEPFAATSEPETARTLARPEGSAQPAGTGYGDYPEAVASYLAELYDPSERAHAYRPDYPGGFEKWQTQWRAELTKLLGFDKIAEANKTHTPRVDVGQPEDLGAYTRAKGWIETEPHVRIPFWLLRPKGEGPFPLALFPHGH